MDEDEFIITYKRTKQIPFVDICLTNERVVTNDNIRLDIKLPDIQEVIN